MSQERIIELDPFILSYLKDNKPPLLIRKFVTERFLDICHEICSSDGVFCDNDLNKLLSHPYYKIKKWVNDVDSSGNKSCFVVLEEYSPFEMLNDRPKLTTSEKILSLLAAIPPLAAQRIVSRLKEFIQQEVFS